MPSRFSKLLKFPARIGLRVIVDALYVGAVEEICACVAAVTGTGPGLIGTPRPSSGGKYLAYTVPVTAASADMLDELYQRLGSLPCVRHVI